MSVKQINLWNRNSFAGFILIFERKYLFYDISEAF